MEQAFGIATVWLALAVLSTILASHLRISMALVEICVGMVAAIAADRLFYPNALGADLDWLRFIASAGADFAPFTYRTVVFLGVCIVLLALLPWITSRLIAWYGNRTAAIRTKWILLLLCGLGALALWSGNEAVLPAYLAGMVLAKTIGRDNSYICRLRTLTIRFLTPFYFIRAGSLVSLPALASAAFVFLTLFAGKAAFKVLGLFPVIGTFREDNTERWYYTLLMSTGLTFGTISALYGLTHEIVNQDQYSFLVAAVIASAVVPTMIANAVFLPRHLLPNVPLADEEIPQLEAASAGMRMDASNGLADEQG